MSVYLIIFSIGLPWLGGVLVWIIGDRHPRWQHGLATIFAILGGVSSLGLLLDADAGLVLQIQVGGVFGDFTIFVDGLGVYLAVIAGVIGSLTVLFSNGYMKDEEQLGRYYALTLLFIGAMVGLVLSGSLLYMFIFWEITAFCSYALISFHNDDPKAVAGGIKALIITQIGGIGLLGGAIATYIYHGDYQIQSVLQGPERFPPEVLGIIAFGFLIAAAAKSAQVPFHTWLPDAMEAPTPISALIHAATMVNAGVYLLARFFPAFKAVPGWATSVMVIGLVSAVLGALMAVFCNDLKRILAYSTISQLGYMVYAIGVGAINASQFHLFSHSIFKALLFLGAGALIHSVGTRDIYQMGGLRKLLPKEFAVFVVGSLALTGLPITNGFFSKELVLEAGLHHGPIWAYLCMLFGAGITGLYTLRMMVLVFYRKECFERLVHTPGVAMQVPLMALAIGALSSWLLVGPFTILLAESLPYHGLSIGSTQKIASETISSPATWITVLIVLIGMLVWLIRDRVAFGGCSLQPAVRFFQAGLGFDDVNRQIVNLTEASAGFFCRLQTGLLSWNVLGIVGMLVILLSIIIWSV
jgi:NADH-quinone oxidoreductase subunit L